MYKSQMEAISALLKAKKAQSSLEYIMMLSAVSIIIVIALAMITQLKGTALHAFFGNSSQSVSSQIANQLSNMTAGLK
jgi:flagellar biosynthesis/type III secretory pathway M-ring protein FliF/YscJ